MIIDFKCKETAKILNRQFSRKLPHAVQVIARRKLIMIHQAYVIDDLRAPPGNRLEKLTGDREGYYSIRINKQWRICFKWEGNNALSVEIVDYH